MVVLDLYVYMWMFVSVKVDDEKERETLTFREIQFYAEHNNRDTSSVSPKKRFM